MTEIYLHFIFAHYGLYGNAPVVPSPSVCRGMQSLLPKAVWQLGISAGCVIERGLQQPRPVVSDHPEPATHPQASVPWPVVGGVTDTGEGPGCGAVELTGAQAVFPWFAWHCISSAGCVSEPAPITQSKLKRKPENVWEGVK